MMDAVRQGLSLCGSAVIPALFPYMVMTHFLLNIGVMDGLRPRAQVFLLGAVGGYPIGAQCAADLFRSGRMDSREASVLAAVCNNASPAFCIFYAGQTLFHSTRAGVLLYAAQLLASAVLQGFFPAVSVPGLRRKEEKEPLSILFVESIRTSAMTTVVLCGFVVFFRVVVFFLQKCLPFLPPSLFGVMELTWGLSVLDGSRRISLVAAGFLVGWGGFCTAAQTAAVLSRAGVSPRGYLGKKWLAACLTALFCGLGCEWAL